MSQETAKKKKTPLRLTFEDGKLPYRCSKALSQFIRENNVSTTYSKVVGIQGVKKTGEKEGIIYLGFTGYTCPNCGAEGYKVTWLGANQTCVACNPSTRPVNSKGLDTFQFIGGR